MEDRVDRPPRERVEDRLERPPRERDPSDWPEGDGSRERESDRAHERGSRARRSRTAELAAFAEWFRDAVISPTGHSPRVVRQRRLALGALLAGALGVIIAIIASQTGGGGSAPSPSSSSSSTPSGHARRHPRTPIAARPSPTLRTRVAVLLPAPVQDPAVTALPAAAPRPATARSRTAPSTAAPGTTTGTTPTTPRGATPRTTVPSAKTPTPRLGALVLGGLDSSDNSVADIYAITVGRAGGATKPAAAGQTGTGRTTTGPTPAGTGRTTTGPTPRGTRTTTTQTGTGPATTGPSTTRRTGAAGAQTARVRTHSLLPTALHDAAAVTLGSSAYLFGGGQLEGSRPDILRITAGGSVRPAGTLPQPASDVGAAVIGSTAYIVGGYTGSRALDTVVAWQPGQTARVVGHLPAPVRYPAVTAVSGRLIIVGGNNQAGTASRDVLSFNPATGQAIRLGRLRRSLTHAAGAVLGGVVYVFGGRGTGTSTQRRTILAIDPRTGNSTDAGVLPRKLSDAGVVALPDRILVVGGRDSSGTVRAEVLSVSHR